MAVANRSKLVAPAIIFGASKHPPIKKHRKVRMISDKPPDTVQQSEVPR
jgi:hypothetical protein